MNKPDELAKVLIELPRLLAEAPPPPYRYGPRTHGLPSDGPTYVALEAKYEGRWEEVATGDYERWNGMGIELAAAAVNALPTLLDAATELAHMTEARDSARQRVAELEAAVERVRELHYPADNDPARTPRCEGCHGRTNTHPCGCWADVDREPVCGHCNQGHKGLSVAWPCPTIRALGATPANPYRAA